MKSYVYTLNLKNNPELIDNYLEYHQAVWPEVIESVRRIGLISDRIYRLGTRLVMILEVEDNFDPQSDLQKYTDQPRAREWDELMQKFQEPLPEAKPGEWWALMDKIFDMDDYN